MVVGCELKALCEDGEVRYEEAPPCGKNAHCQDGWTCRCDKGYTGDGRQCEAGILSFFLSFSLRSSIGGVAYVAVSISSATQRGGRPPSLLSLTMMSFLPVAGASEMECREGYTPSGDLSYRGVDDSQDCCH